MAISAKYAPSTEGVERKERRSAPRFRLTLPIVVHRIPLRQEADLIYGKTRDISTNGLFFTTYELVEPGTKFELSFELPFEATEDRQILVTVQASAVRIVAKPETVFEHIGIGAVIEKFQILQARP